MKATKVTMTVYSVDKGTWIRKELPIGDAGSSYNEAVKTAEKAANKGITSTMHGPDGCRHFMLIPSQAVAYVTVEETIVDSDEKNDDT